VLVSATRDDLPGLASLHRLAFEPTKIMRYLHTDVDPDVFNEFFVKRFTKVMNEAEEKNNGGSVITVAKRGWKPLGFAWTTREPAAKDRPAEEKEKPERPLMEGADPVRSRELLGALDRHANTVPFPHWSQCQVLSRPETHPLLLKIQSIQISTSCRSTRQHKEPALASVCSDLRSTSRWRRTCRSLSSQPNVSSTSVRGHM
jgi:hypothetical protein